MPKSQGRPPRPSESTKLDLTDGELSALSQFNLLQQSEKQKQSSSTSSANRRRPESSRPKPSRTRPEPSRSRPQQPQQPTQLANVPNLSGGAGLNCFSCGSLLDPSKKCDKFDQRDPTQTQVCGTNEACLYYRWKKSDEDVGKSTSAPGFLE